MWESKDVVAILLESKKNVVARDLVATLWESNIRFLCIRGYWHAHLFMEFLGSPPKDSRLPFIVFIHSFNSRHTVVVAMLSESLIAFISWPSFKAAGMHRCNGYAMRIRNYSNVYVVRIKSAFI
jgi:hypothetical protein